MRLIGWDQRRVVSEEPMALAVEFSFGLPFEDRHLLITVMRMQRNLRADRETGQPCCHVLRADLFRDQGDRLDTVAAVDHRQRIDSQNMRFCHGKISSPNSTQWRTVTVPLTARQVRPLMMTNIRI